MKINVIKNLLFILCIWFYSSVIISCMSWEQGWEQIEKPSMKGNISTLILKANKQLGLANNKKEVLKLINLYESILKIDPENYEALWSLGRYYMLMGTGYSSNKKEKEDYYMKGIIFCEQAMYTNSNFKVLVNKGVKLWDACKNLTKREMAAMNYWNANVGLYWKECLCEISKLFNAHWLIRINNVLIRMIEIDPAWAGGHPYTSMALSYTMLPGILGGDMKKADDYFRKAINAGPKWLYIRWARAKYFHTKNNDREAYKADLQWIISQDPHKSDSPYPWNVYFQKSAKELLENIDQYF